MYLNDSCPERRNLILYSMMTIVFVVGGAEIGNTIKMPLLGLTLTNTKALVVMYWIIFAYLNYSFWTVFRFARFDPDNPPEYNSPANISVAVKCAIAYPSISLKELKAILGDDATEEVKKSYEYAFCVAKKSEKIVLKAQKNNIAGTTRDIDQHLTKIQQYFFYAKRLIRCSFAHPYPRLWLFPWGLTLTSSLMALYSMIP